MAKKGKGKEDKSIINVFGLIGGLILLAIIQAYIAPLNPEILIQNWGIGVIGFIIFSVLYLISCLTNLNGLLFRPKRLWFFMMVASTCFIIVDWMDFIIFMRGG